MAPEICFPTPSEESSSAIPPASIRREFPKSFNDGEKFSDGEKKWMTLAENHNFVVSHHRHLFARGRMSDAELGSMRSAAG